MMTKQKSERKEMNKNTASAGFFVTLSRLRSTTGSRAIYFNSGSGTLFIELTTYRVRTTGDYEFLLRYRQDLNSDTSRLVEQKNLLRQQNTYRKYRRYHPKFLRRFMIVRLRVLKQSDRVSRWENTNRRHKIISQQKIRTKHTSFFHRHR